jgi:hypothetical protein
VRPGVGKREVTNGLLELDLPPAERIGKSPDAIDRLPRERLAGCPLLYLDGARLGAQVGPPLARLLFEQFLLP